MNSLISLWLLWGLLLNRDSQSINLGLFYLVAPVMMSTIVKVPNVNTPSKINPSHSVYVPTSKVFVWLKDFELISKMVPFLGLNHTLSAK